MVTRRGAFARSLDTFKGELRAVQVVGAKDPEMQRDIIVGASPGHAWIQGQVSLYGNLAYVQASVIDGLESDIPVIGDEVFIYLSKSAFPAATQADRFIRFTVEEMILGPMAETSPYQLSFLVRWSGSPPDAVTLPSSGVYRGGISKKGAIRISSIPDIGAVSLSIPNAEVHVYGHSDVYLRPVLRQTGTAVLSGLSDDSSVVERSVLSTTAGSNTVTDSGLNFASAGVTAGYILIIETGVDAGVYTVVSVSTNNLYLNQNLSTTAANLRYRVINKISINPFSPKTMKLPFGAVTAVDLQTTIGSKTFKLATNDVLLYGAAVGDTFEILSGTDEGTFTIVGFDSVLGGKGVIVDRAAAGTNAGLSYRIYKSLEAVVLPLVRLKDVLLLDSSEQSTGITVPPAIPVGVVTTSAFTSAKVRGGSRTRSGWILPDITGYVDAANEAAVTGTNKRYSTGVDTPDGYYKGVQFPDSGNSQVELDYRSDTKGKCSWFVSVAETEVADENFPPIDPKPGECLNIKNGPNKGNYLIRQVVKFKTLNANDDIVWYYFTQIHGTFPVDVFKGLFDFMVAGGIDLNTAFNLPITNGLSPVLFPSFFTDIYTAIPAKIGDAITTLGGTDPGDSTILAAVDEMVLVDYSWGDPARGVLRSYFTEPTRFKQITADADDVTKYLFTTTDGEEIFYRPDPNMYAILQVVPLRLSGDTDDLLLPRDLDYASTSTANFTDSTQPSMINLGVLAGDILEVHLETFFFGTDKTRQLAVQTVTGSNTVTAHSTASAPFTSDMEGSILLIEEGADLGAYRVTAVPTSSTLTLDRPLTVSTPTPTPSLYGTGANWGYDGGLTKNKLVVGSGTPFVTGHIGKYLTLYGIDTAYQGSYEILSIISNTTVELGRTGNFPPYQADTSLGRWIVTDAPVTPPIATMSGTELVAVRPVRMYEDIATEYTITIVKYDDPTVSFLTFSPASLRNGFKQPYKITRKNVRVVTPTEMDELRDGALCYFDTEVVSLSPNDSANIQQGSYLVPVDGTFESDGYRHVVDNSNMTYSMKETGKIHFPTSILPVGSEDSPVNRISLAGTPVQIDYERSDLVLQFQDFLDSGEDRVTTANMLARHFLPTYASYDATYTGGSAASIVAKAIRDYIDNVPIETSVDVSEVEKQIISRGGNPETPTKVTLILHDWDRRMWMETSENKVGGTSTPVPYNGTPRVSYYISGPDVSGQTVIQVGERINLTKV